MEPEDPTVIRANSISSTDYKVHKSSSLSPAIKAGSLNPRSCVTCRKRKVKCDKNHPCSNCARANIECVFPAPGRAPRKPRKPQDPDLAERLRRLESLVQSLGQGGQTDEDSSPKNAQITEEEAPKEEETHDQKIARAKKELKSLFREKMAMEEKNPPADVEDMTSRFGTLISGEGGRSRYISPGLWASLNAAVEDIKDKLHESEEEDEEYGSPSTSETSSNQAFLFGLSSNNVQMTLLHPVPAHVSIYWDAYKENVDPLFKHSHTPTMEKMVMESAGKLNNLSRHAECMMFSIYYAAVCSMSESSCLTKLGEAKGDLLARYKFANEQSLARADFLRTDSVFVLQAFTLFLLCLRRYEDGRYIWSMSSLALRLAQGIGVHRDGSHYPSLTPFKQEMRRRIWWTIASLDLRASEDLGSDLAIYDMMSDSKLPRNLNDADLTMDMKELPESRQGGTDMTFALVRFEVSNLLRKVSFHLGMKHNHHFKKNKPHHHRSLEDKKSMIQSLNERLEKDYFAGIDESVPMFWLAKVVARLVTSKMYLMIYHSEQRKDGGKSLPQDVRDMLFQQSIDNIELSITLQEDPRVKRFQWLLQTYMQWHALAFILSELCVRTTGPLVDQAWKVVDTAMRHQTDEINKLGSHLWKPLKLLRAKAKMERVNALSKEIGEVTPINFNDGEQQANPTVTTLDFGVDRLYPIMPNPASTSAFSTDDQVNSWQGQSLTMSPVVFSPGMIAQVPLLANQGQSGLSDTSVSQADSSNQAFQPVEIPPDWSPGDTQDVSMIDPQSINWASWDDMVQEFNMQNEMATRVNGDGKIPSYFGNGPNWY